MTESSVLISLRELRTMEDQRVAEEREAFALAETEHRLAAERALEARRHEEQAKQREREDALRLREKEIELRVRAETEAAARVAAEAARAASEAAARERTARDVPNVAPETDARRAPRIVRAANTGPWLALALGAAALAMSAMWWRAEDARGDLERRLAALDAPPQPASAILGSSQRQPAPAVVVPEELAPTRGVNTELERDLRPTPRPRARPGRKPRPSPVDPSIRHDCPRNDPLCGVPGSTGP